LLNQYIEAFMDAPQQAYLSADEVCSILGIQAATLYSYVSRGLIRSVTTASKQRERQYAAEDVARLVAKAQNRRDPQVTAERAARESLRWGVPVLESALTLMTPHGHYYRGQSALELAQTHSFEAVAELLWDQPQAFQSVPIMTALPIPATPAVIDRLIQTLLALPDAQSAHLLWAAARTVALSNESHDSIAGLLTQVWGGDATLQRLINAALILCMDHELNASAFAVRVAASTDADLRHALMAGLAVLSGSKHGGATETALALLDAMPSVEQVRVMVTQYLNRGQRVPGFGHRLYPNGDPRAQLLLGLIQKAYPDAGVLAVADVLQAVMRDMTGLYANVDLALAVLQRAAGLPGGSALGLFALGRMVGWMAHALEQYAAHALIRPRAKYVGIMPDRADTE
jgi:citrate synthase